MPALPQGHAVGTSDGRYQWCLQTQRLSLRRRHLIARSSSIWPRLGASTMLLSARADRPCTSASRFLIVMNSPVERSRLVQVFSAVTFRAELAALVKGPLASIITGGFVRGRTQSSAFAR